MNILRKNKSNEHVQPQVPLATKVELNAVSLSINNKPILHHLSFALPAVGMTSLIGPSGAGKSSVLRCMNMLQKDWQGLISVDGIDIRHWKKGSDALRQYMGLIAQKPAVFPTSIANNVIFGLSRAQRRTDLDVWIEQCLRQAALWDEVKDRLQQAATTLSVGQQQRLCLARALALKPSMLLLDEPTASLDPRSKELIEDSLRQLAKAMPVLCVTHDLEQAMRLKGQVIFMCEGKVIEMGHAESFFKQPQELKTREFLRWEVCDCD